MLCMGSDMCCMGWHSEVGWLAKHRCKRCRDALCMHSGVRAPGDSESLVSAHGSDPHGSAPRWRPGFAASELLLGLLLETILAADRRLSTWGEIGSPCFTTPSGQPGRVWKGPTASTDLAGSVPTTTSDLSVFGKAPPPLIPRAWLRELCPASRLARVRLGHIAP